MTARIADPALEPPITLEDRDLIIPDELRIIGVAHDNWAEKVHFEFPTSFDENSWQGKLIYIDFMNAGGESDTQPILESTIEDGVLKFAWEIDNRFTRYNGTARFAVRITSSDGYRFGTKISAVEISEGIYVESEIDAEVTSRLEQWEARIAELIDDASTTSSKVNGLADSYTKNISQLTNTTTAANEAIAKAETAIDRATEAYNNTLKEPITEDNYLNGIRYTGEKFHGKCSRSGIEVMHITGKTTQERTNGYQLFDMSAIPSSEKNGVKIFNNGNGSYSAFGTPTGTYNATSEKKHEYLANLKVGTLYAKRDSALPFAYMKFYSGDTTLGEVTTGASKTFDITEEQLNDPDVKMEYMFYGSQDQAPTARSFKPMFYQDGDGTWEPFTGGKPGPNPDYPLPLKSFEASKVVCMGKNVAVVDPKSSSKKCTFEQLKDGMTVIKATGEDVYIGEVAITAGDAYARNNGFLFPVPDDAIKVYVKSFDGVLTKNLVCFYDAHLHSLGYKTFSTTLTEVPVPDDAKFITVRVGPPNAVAGQTYTDRVMVSFEPITEWVPPHYEEIELPEPLILRSCATGEYDELLEDGTIVRRCKEIESPESVTYESSAGNWRIYIKVSDEKTQGYTVNVRYPIFCTIGAARTGSNEGIAFYYPNASTGTRLFANLPDSLTTEAEAKAWYAENRSKIRFIYPLAVPTFETYPMPILPSWDDECRAFFVSETETEIEWRPCTIGDRSREIQKLEEKITDLETEIVDLKTASVNSETAG